MSGLFFETCTASSRVNPLPQEYAVPCGSGFTREEASADTTKIKASGHLSSPGKRNFLTPLAQQILWYTIRQQELITLTRSHP
ncbi:hypothetical protein EFJ98_16155 [Pseudomonas putida]|nr:hypothetical protein EFJ98_16155 [Pseudomonas putida]